MNEICTTFLRMNSAMQRLFSSPEDQEETIREIDQAISKLTTMQSLPHNFSEAIGTLNQHWCIFMTTYLSVQSGETLSPPNTKKMKEEMEKTFHVYQESMNNSPIPSSQRPSFVDSSQETPSPISGYQAV